MNHKDELVKRLKAFGWHTGMMVLAAGISFAMANLNLVDLPSWSTVLLGLVLGQASKWVTNWLSLNS